MDDIVERLKARMDDIVERLKAKIAELEEHDRRFSREGFEVGPHEDTTLFRDALPEIERLRKLEESGGVYIDTAEIARLQARLAALEEAAQTALPVLDDLGLATEGSLIEYARDAAARIRAALSASPHPRDELREARVLIEWFVNSPGATNHEFLGRLKRAAAWLEAHPAPEGA